MSIEIKVPPLPESVSDATLIAWHKKVGDAVSRDENLVDLETDKIVLEVPAPSSGVLQEIRVQDGATVTAGDVLAIFEQRDSATTADEKPASKANKKLTQPKVKKDSKPIKTSPAVRRLLEEHDLDETMVIGTGKDGRVTKADVLGFLKSDDSSNVTPGDPAPVVVDADEIVGLERTDQRVPMTRLRVRIAERLVDAQQSAAMLTTFNEVDLTKVMSLRSRHRDAFEKKHGVRLGFMSFFAKAATEALKRFPVVNASIEGTDIIYHNYYDIGIAVSTERGLMVPVIRNVDQMSFADFEKDLGEVAKKAQAGTIGMEELTGGTFTITNGGIFGSMMSTPILNQPQSAILGMHSIQKRPMVVDDEIVVRPMMYLALTYDHRVVDGKDSVQFLVAIKELLEDPGRLLLQV
jgi:2-oxoglutarate dehydrogenase E2 component (dihydrolipoamide succinyltransferase)